MLTRDNYLELDDDQLLGQCEVDTYKASGPGGQHRNKVSSAVRLRHKPTEIMAHGNDSRSQHENKRLALKRLRKNLATQLRNPVDRRRIPAQLDDVIFTPKKNSGKAPCRLEIGRKDHRFWNIAALLLDILEAYEGRLSDASDHLAISTSNLIKVLKQDRHLLGAAQDIRRQHGQKPIH